MTLEVIKDGKNNIYPDEAKLPLNQWREMLSLAPSTIADALYRQRLHPEEGPPRHLGEPNQKLIPIEQFPDIIRGLAMAKVQRLDGTGDYLHPWTTGVDSTQDFQVVNHKGTTLAYTYPEK